MIRFDSFDWRAVAQTSLLQIRIQLVAGCENEADKWSRWLGRPWQVLGVVLNTNVVFVVAKLHNLHSVAIFRLAHKYHAALFDVLHVFRVHFIAVTMTFIHKVDVSVKFFFDLEKSNNEYYIMLPFIKQIDLCTLYYVR